MTDYLSDADAWGSQAQSTQPSQSTSAPTAPQVDPAALAQKFGAIYDANGRLSGFTGQGSLGATQDPAQAANVARLFPEIATRPAPASAPSAPNQTGPSDSELWPAGASPSASQTAEPQKSDALGLYAGAIKPIDNLATWIHNGIGAIPGVGQPLVNAIDSLPTTTFDSNGVHLDHKSFDQIIQGHQQGIADLEAQGVEPSVRGQIAGGILGTLPAAMIIKSPTAIGALGGLLSTNNPNDPIGAARDTALGAIGGKLTSGVLSVAGHALSPVVAPAAQKLMDAGVNLSPGQIMGGGWRTIEDGLSHLPFIGNAIKGAQSEATTSFNRVALNRALAPVGETLPAHIGVGNEAIGYISDKLGQKYNDLLPGVPSFNIDQPFVDGLANLYQNGVDGVTLGPAQQARLKDILTNTLFSRVADDGSISGKNMQAVDSTLGTMAKGFGGGQNSFDDQTLGKAIGAVQGGLRDLFARSNPQAASDLANINEGWANFARLRAAASSLGAKEGIFSAPQLQNAVKAADKSAGKGAFASRKALMQDLSAPGAALLPSTVADSGTTTHGLMDGAIIGMMSGHGAEHVVTPHVMLPAAALMAPYSAKGLPIVRGILAASRPSAARAAGAIIRGTARPAAVLGGILGPGQYPATDPASPTYGLLAQ